MDDHDRMRREPTDAEIRLARRWARRYDGRYDLSDDPIEDMQEREFAHALEILVFANARPPYTPKYINSVQTGYNRWKKQQAADRAETIAPAPGD